MDGFIIIGNKNAFTYKEIFPYIKNNELWLGITKPDVTKEVKGLCRWFTNIPHKGLNKPLLLSKEYNSIDYPKYDNYDAIEVSKVKDIPIDYNGIMGVPVTFLDNYNSTQFEILLLACGNTYANTPKKELEVFNFNPNIKYGGGLGAPVLNGKGVYARVLIRKKGHISRRAPHRTQNLF